MNKAITTAIVIAAVGILIAGASLFCAAATFGRFAPSQQGHVQGQGAVSGSGADEKFVSVDDLLDKRQLTLLGVVLAFLAYVSVGEGQIITARHEEVKKQRARARITDADQKTFRRYGRKISLQSINYIGLLAGDFLLIGTAWYLFFRIVNPFPGPLWDCPIPLLPMLAGVVLTAIHLVNWIRGLISIFANSRNPAITDAQVP